MANTLVRFVELSAPRLAFGLLAAFALTLALRSHDDTTIALVASALAMFGVCWANAIHLFGARIATRFVLIAVGTGWFAEQMGASRGWFFGSYRYTDVLGFRLGEVPVVIPLMWFALSYVGVVTANLIIWQKPATWESSPKALLFTSFVAAALVTAYDLAADPYMVYVLRAWVMTETDGDWFGETLQGFVGWMTVAFCIIAGFRLTTRRLSRPGSASYSATDALVPLSIYGGSMVFQMIEGHPVETRTVAAFAMGVPLLCALAGWWRFRNEASVVPVAAPVSDARLWQLQFHADPLADETIADVVGSSPNSASVGGSEAIGLLNRQMNRWDSNQSLLSWPNNSTGMPDDAVASVQRYLRVGQKLPEWADAAKIERAEVLFWDYGALSCTLLFCASLPECYQLPNLARVLHVAGQLEKHTEHRIRAPAAMVFPVMMHGGLRDPNASGVAQVLKVRLIHAAIRHLILRGSPDKALDEVGDLRFADGAPIIEPLPSSADSSLHEALHARGWNTASMGLPCNQEELAYTLLTFSYVCLRSLRKLGIGLTPDDERAVLHAWNVVGHLLGIRRELMADTMEQAAALFTQMQAPRRLSVEGQDPRPHLGKALMQALERSIPFRLLKPFPALMTIHLCGAATARTVGIDAHVSWLSRAVFVVLSSGSRAVDSLVRLVLPEFSISRMVARVLGYHFMKRVLLDQTRPLNLPEHLLGQVNEAIAGWGNDPNAPRWLRTLEDKLTTPGTWTANSGQLEGK